MSPTILSHQSLSHEQKISNLLMSKKQPNFLVGETYKVNLTHVNTPSNFFVQLVSTLENKANLMNNLNNFYRNERLEIKDGLLKFFKISLNLC